MKNLMILTASAVTLGLSGTAMAQGDFTRNASADTMIVESAADTNNGSTNPLWYTSRYSVPMVGWDLSDQAGLVATGDATLSFRAHNHLGYAATVAWVPILADWEEGSVTWESFVGTNPATSNTWANSDDGFLDHYSTLVDIDAFDDAHQITIDEGGVRYEFTIPQATIQGWLDDPSSNHGLALYYGGGDYVNFGVHTREAFSFEPHLTFSTAIPEPTSLALLGMGGLAMLRRRRA